MKICPKCQYTSDRDGVNHCYSDGTKMEELHERRCQCGYLIGLNDRYCEGCGSIAPVKDWSSVQ